MGLIMGGGSGGKEVWRREEGGGRKEAGEGCVWVLVFFLRIFSVSIVLRVVLCVARCVLCVLLWWCGGMTFGLVDEWKVYDLGGADVARARD